MNTDRLPEYVWSKIEVANQLHEIMFSRSLTQEKWADKAEVAKSQLSNILCGKTLPRIDSLIRLAKAVGCRVEIRIVTESTDDEAIFQDLAQAYWNSEYKFTPEERAMLRKHYMIYTEDERNAA